MRKKENICIEEITTNSWVMELNKKIKVQQKLQEDIKNNRAEIR